MSTEERLDRLGLLHLKDDPAALEKALRSGIDAHAASVAAWRRDADRRWLAGWTKWLTLGGRLGEGHYAVVYATDDPACVVKIARATDDTELPASTDAPTVSKALGLSARGVAFHTGSFGAAQVDPNEVLACEAAVLRAATSPPWVRLIEEAEIDGRRVLVLERIAGTTLRKALGAGESTPQIILKVARALVAGGRVHGDLKPENIFVDEAGDVRLIDPSSGYVRGEGGAVSRMLTTPLYNPALVGSDVPALGLMLAEVLLGGPFLMLLIAVDRAARKASSLHEKMDMLERMGRPVGWIRRLAPPSFFPKPVSPAIDEVVLRALGFAMREGELVEVAAYGGAAEFAEGLAAALVGGGRRLRLRLDGKVIGELREGEELVIGRTAPATVVIPVGVVARRHVRIALSAAGAEVEDLRSHCGTYVNAHLVQGRKPLADGDEIGIGFLRVRVEIVRGVAG